MEYGRRCALIKNNETIYNRIVFILYIDYMICYVAFKLSELSFLIIPTNIENEKRSSGNSA